MDKLFVRKDVYDELIEKGFGKRDYSKLTKKVITDKNGHRRTVFVKNDVEQTEQKQPNAQEGLTPEKKARYEEMLEKVKNGPNENALFVSSKGMLNKKDAIAHLEGKLGKNTVSSAAQGHLESDTPQNTDITAEDEARFGKQALSGLSGKRTSSEEYKENYLDAKNEGGKDIAENNKIETLSEKIEFSPDEMKMIRDTAKEIGYKVGKDEGKLLNAINSKDKAMYSALTKKNQKVWDESGKTQKTFSQTDLLKEKIQSMNGDFGADDSGSKFDEEMEEEDTTAKTFEDAIKNYNFTDEKKNQFAMDEVAKFYPDLKETVDKHRKAFRDVDDAKRKLSINPNNKEYQKNFKNAVNELSKMNKEYESKAVKALEKAPNIPKPSFEKYMDARRKVDKFKETYKKQLEEFEVGERLRANGGAAFLNPMYGLKPNDYTKDSDYINAQMTIRAFERK